MTEQPGNATMAWQSTVHQALQVEVFPEKIKTAPF